jgi:hypothetical protein
MMQRLEQRIRSSEWRTLLQGLTREEDRREFLTMLVGQPAMSLEKERGKW